MPNRRILAIGIVDERTQILDTETGELHEWDKLAVLVSRGSGGYVVGTNLYRYAGALNRIFEGYPNWRLYIRAHRRTVIRGERRQAVGTFLPVYFGFVRTSDQRSVVRSRVFHCMDLDNMCGLKQVRMTDALAHAESILDLCDQRDVKFTGSRGGLAARLLKASPYWEPGRAAAPAFVNEQARAQLPGNYHGLGARTGERYGSAVYMDQVSAHHAVAASIEIPLPAGIRARGQHRMLESGRVESWIRDPHKVPGVGLLACMISVQKIPEQRLHLFPPFMHEPGTRLAYIYTNELDYLNGRYGTVDYVVAAWTGVETDPAIREYAEWSLGVRNEGPGRKALLLAAYGALALRTDLPATSYRDKAGRGKLTELPGAGQLKETTRTRKPNQPQPRVVNVLARGLIEAETRKRSIMLAREMDAMGIPVLSIYVDGLILHTDSPPLPPPGWAIESGLTNLRFHNPTSFTSDEMTKLPGVPRGLRGHSVLSSMAAAKRRVASGNVAWRRDEKTSLSTARAIVYGKIREQRAEAEMSRRPT